MRRTPKNYDGINLTGREMRDLLPDVLAKIGSQVKQRPDLVLLAWPEIVGAKLSPMTQAVSFIDGVLTVKVKNSSLYSLLSQHERPKLLQTLQNRFPSIAIRNILFRMG